jgi:hypothetical protein
VPSGRPTVKLQALETVVAMSSIALSSHFTNANQRKTSPEICTTPDDKLQLSGVRWRKGCSTGRLPVQAWMQPQRSRHGRTSCAAWMAFNMFISGLSDASFKILQTFAFRPTLSGSLRKVHLESNDLRRALMHASPTILLPFKGLVVKWSKWEV